MKVVIDFFLGVEVINSWLNLSFGVGNFVCIFSLWDWCTSKGKAMVECVGLLSFNNYSLVIGSNETCHPWATCCSWLVGDIGSYWVVVLGESTSD